MKIALGIPTWQDGREALMGCISSCSAWVDEIIIADGIIEGVIPFLDEDVFPITSDWLPGWATVASHMWPSQAEQRTWLLRKAQQLGCDWLLQLDADEQLEQPELLTEWLQGWTQPAFPIAFEYQPGHFVSAPWKLLRVKDWERIVADGYIVEHVNGTLFELRSEDGKPPRGWALAPWISHYPELRPLGPRRDIRMNEWIGRLEPHPKSAIRLELDLQSPRLLQSLSVGIDETAPLPEATHYCDQCGQRYAGPGLCDNGHEPTPVVPLDTPAETPAEPPDAAVVPDAAYISPDAPFVEASVDTEASPVELSTTAPVEEGTEAASGGGAAPAVPVDTATTQAPPAANPEPPASQAAPSIATQAAGIIADARQALDRLADLIHGA